MYLKIKKVIKKFVDYTIENDVRIYTLKHTVISLKRPLTEKFMQQYGTLPVAANKIVLDNYMGGGYGCNGKYVTEALLGSGKEYDIVWTVKNAEGRTKEFPAGVRLVEYLSEEALYEYATAGVWLCNYHLIAYFNRGLMKKPGQNYIQMWHGSFGIKKIENDCGILTQSQSWSYLAKKSSRNTDYWISNSAFETAVYKRAFWDVERVLELGHPRNDIFFREDRHLVEKKVRAALCIGPEDNIILYVPTFREKYEFPGEKLDVDRLRAELFAKTGKNWAFVVRLHPRMRGEDEAVCSSSQSTVYRADDYPDIQELLAAAQVVITDYSSCIFDFLLTRRPGFIYAPDISAYNDERGFYYRLEETPFPVASENGELFENIRNFDAVRYAERVQNFLKDKGNVEDGRAAMRVCELIDKLSREKENQHENQ